MGTLHCNEYLLQKQGFKKIAIIGGNAKAVILSGGGSAALKPSYFVSPYDGIVQALGGGVEITYSEGARGKHCDFRNSFVGNSLANKLATMTSPTLDFEIVTEKGDRGWIGEWFPHESDDSMVPLPTPIKTQYIDETRAFFR